jgi:hypothetical protein
MEINMTLPFRAALFATILGGIVAPAVPSLAGGISVDLPRLTFPDPVATPATKGCSDQPVCPPVD